MRMVKHLRSQRETFNYFLIPISIKIVDGLMVCHSFAMYVKGGGFGPLLKEASTSMHNHEPTRAETEELRLEVLCLIKLVASCNETNAQLLDNQARTKAILKKFEESISDLETLFADD